VALFDLTITVNGVLRHVFEGADAPLVGVRDIMAQLDRLILEVQETKTVMASASALIADLAQRIRDNAGNEAALQALADELDAAQGALGEAIAANTPGEEPPVEPPPDEV
jgi:hypothetical protein